jgi:hypothetical protein
MTIDSYEHCPARDARTTDGAALRAHLPTPITEPASAAGGLFARRGGARQEARQ